MNLVIYTSLPEVGGHTIVSLKLAALLRHCFDRIWIGAKVMPGHGTSADAVWRLRRMGCIVQELGNKRGGLCLTALTRWILQVPFGKETVFLCIGMRYSPPLFTLLLQPSHSVYYHITHELTPATVRRLDIYRCFFTTLLFVCPATFHQFAHLRPTARNLAWVTQASECEDFVWGRCKTRGRRRFSLRVFQSLDRSQGSKVLLEFARHSQVPCELHVAGVGEFQSDFERLAAHPVSPVKVVYHGTFFAF